MIGGGSSFDRVIAVKGFQTKNTSIQNPLLQPPLHRHAHYLHTATCPQSHPETSLFLNSHPQSPEIRLYVQS